MNCDCGRVTGPVYTLDQCRACWLCRYDPRYTRRCGVSTDVPTELSAIPAVGGPGTELKRLLFWAEQDEDCSCRAHSDEMDRLGPDWCAANLDKIVAWLRDEHKRRRSTVPFVAPVARALVRLAIWRSRKTAVPKVSTWAVGVTTSGQRRAVDGCLASLRRAGWDNAIVFAEPDSYLPSDGCETIQRPHRLGAWDNKLQGFRDLQTRQPNADVYLMLEDDALVATTAKWTLEQHGLPSERCSMLSLYRPSGRMRGEPPNQRWQDTDELCDLIRSPYARIRPDGDPFGSVAVVVPAAYIESLLEWDHSGVKGDRFSDIRLRRWARSVGEYWLCKPSLAQHRQDVPSELGHGVAGAEMRANDFVEESSDA